MRSNKEMTGTNRMAIKTKDGVKVVVERKTVDGDELYLVGTDGDIIMDGMVIPNDMLLVLQGLTFKDNDMYIDAILFSNIGLRVVWLNQNGPLKEMIGSYTIEPEEDIISNDIHLCIPNISKVSVDPDMFNDMMKDELIVGEPKILSGYGLYYSQLKIYKEGPKNNIMVKPIKKKRKVIARRKNDN